MNFEKKAHEFFLGLAVLGLALGLAVFAGARPSGFDFGSERPTEAVEVREFMKSSFVIELPPRKSYHKKQAASSLYKLLLLTIVNAKSFDQSKPEA